MKLIFSIQGDYTTTIVCKWLRFYNKAFLRINGDKNEAQFNELNAPNNQIYFTVNGEKHDLNKSDAIWYRKSGLGLRHFKANYMVNDKDILLEEGYELRNIVKAENKTLLNFIHNKLEQKRSIGKKYNADLNKLEVLDKASKIGLSVPKTFIVTNKSQLQKIINKEGELITKSIKDNLYHFNEKHGYYTYTEKVSLDNINEFPENFSPTLFQNLVEKRYELRVFYLEGKFYSMCVFSQNDKQTELDFRKYNNAKPNRNLSFKLPETVELKLKKLYEELDLDTGSADIMVDKNGNYIFLEINPVGQFTMVSTPCNYYLEREVAKIL
ncbi:ATP-GRASP peptide maturase of grasp-with-spasm system [Tenacibaculum skagerrakense]|uniref:ATP-GRASP peptide maturase of grasp-with-spasm system n=1 Tax=Tenacibaculum skagerrakense TaxID=186571 RepID=A0A4V2SM44_9FLAO|nr:grasp-with-spasm system ATP-grasp peptide maturase [Tenacibaculum skagerrakense]TCP25886.1 ATP-GRASP peptide maturase of grasp-with-spasm system [Tenacibaculum skagerrakense]